MPFTNCLNCGDHLDPVQNYCWRCGQKTDVSRINFRHFFQEFFKTFTNFETGLLHLLRDLAIEPGTVVVRYVEGKRKQYFNPFSFLAICIAITIVVSSAIRPYEGLPIPEYADYPETISDEARYLADRGKVRAPMVDEFTQRNLNLLTVTITPFAAFMLWLFFRNRKRNMAEVATAYIFLTSFSTLITTLIVNPLMLVFTSYLSFNILLWVSMLLQGLYFAWGFNIFFGYNTAGGFFRVLGVLTLACFIGLLALLVFLFYYVYGGSWEVVTYLKPKSQ